MSGERALADAFLGKLAESVTDESGLQGVVQSFNYTNRTCEVLVDGETGTYAYEASYTPNVGDLVWLRGPSGAKVITGRIAGQGAREAIQGAVIDLMADHRSTPTSGAHRISLGHLDGNGNILPNSFVEFRVIGSDLTAFWVNVAKNVGLVFGTDRFIVRTAGGFDNADFEARDGFYRKVWTLDLTATGNILAEGNLFSNHEVRAVGDVLGAAFRGNLIGNQFNVNAGFCTGEINNDPTGSFRAPNFFGGTFHGVLVPSERRLKDEIEPITNGLDVVNALRPARWSWRDSERDTKTGEPHRVHAGIYVDELTDIAPEAVRDNMVSNGDPGHPKPVPSGERTYEDRAVIAYLVAAVQELTNRLNALESQ